MWKFSMRHILSRSHQWPPDVRRDTLVWWDNHMPHMHRWCSSVCESVWLSVYAWRRRSISVARCVVVDEYSNTLTCFRSSMCLFWRWQPRHQHSLVVEISIECVCTASTILEWQSISHTNSPLMLQFQLIQKMNRRVIAAAAENWNLCVCLNAHSHTHDTHAFIHRLLDSNSRLSTNFAFVSI